MRTVYCKEDEDTIFIYRQLMHVLIQDKVGAFSRQKSNSTFTDISAYLIYAFILNTV